MQLLGFGCEATFAVTRQDAYTTSYSSHITVKCPILATGRDGPDVVLGVKHLQHGLDMLQVSSQADALGLRCFDPPSQVGM